VELTSRHSRRVVPMIGFIDGYRHTACRPDEIVTAILVPKRSSATRSHFLKLGARKYLVISIVMVAGVIEADAAGSISVARLAVGSCSATPQRLRELETALAGRHVAEAPQLVTASHFEHLAPIDDIRASAAYRSETAVAMTRDLLSQLGGESTQKAA
jgi:xanthine dehydrogenase small subunit